MPGPLRRRQKTPDRKRTIVMRDFTGGVNLTDSRQAIKDTELSWAENILPVGSGALQTLLPAGDSIFTNAVGNSWVFGCVLNGNPLLILVGTDGSLTQVTPGGVAVVFAPAGSVTGTAGACSFAIWQGTTLLILDETTGYASYDGAVFTVLDSTQRGNALAVFQGRAWVIRDRNIDYTAPNSFTDFSVVNGGGTTVLSDESFPGNIVAAVSAFEQLWLVGTGAVDAISNVTSSGSAPVVTTFSITNILSNLGTTAQHSVMGFLRALTFLSPSGAYGVSGVTPQKLSGKIDGLFPDLTLTHQTVSSAVAIIEDLTCLIFLVRYNGTESVAGAGPVPLLLIFSEGKWVFAYQGALLWITSLLVDGVLQCWGVTATGLHRLFSGAGEITYKAIGKLSDFGSPTTLKQCLKSGLEFQASIDVDPVMEIDNETAAKETQNVQTTVPVTWLNDAGQEVTFVNDSGQVVTFRAQGRVLSRQVSNMWGNYLGFRLSGTHPRTLFTTVLMQIQQGEDKWLTPATTAG